MDVSLISLVHEIVVGSLVQKFHLREGYEESTGNQEQSFVMLGCHTHTHTPYTIQVGLFLFLFAWHTLKGFVFFDSSSSSSRGKQQWANTSFYGRLPPCHETSNVYRASYILHKVVICPPSLLVVNTPQGCRLSSYSLLVVSFFFSSSFFS
jgi:hypothetical protein